MNKNIVQFDDDGEICHTLYDFSVGPYFHHTDRQNADKFKQELNEAIFGENRDWGVFSTVWKFQNPCKKECKICAQNKGRYGHAEYIFSQHSNAMGRLVFTCPIGGVMSSHDGIARFSIRDVFIKKGVLLC